MSAPPPRRLFRAAFAAAFFCLCPLAAQAAPELSLPLSCRIGQDCWVVNYVDIDDAEGRASDPSCGARTYDTHEGTDFGLRDMAAVRAGVDVVAAADGTVMNARDDAEDRMPSPEEIETLKAAKKGCGNGVLIDHGEGWQTIYCHMKKGSVAVKPGQPVKAGEVIGQAGHSGIAEFPHLHFGVFHDGRTVDPFTGAEGSAEKNTPDSAREVAPPACTGAAAPLWRKDTGLRYEPFTLYAAGFAASPPDFEIIKNDAGTPEMLSAAALSSLTFWGAIFGARQGDHIRMEITGPDGRIFSARDIEQDKDRARQFYFIGKRIAPGSLAPGVYTGRVSLSRPAPPAATPAVMERTLTVTP